MKWKLFMTQTNTSYSCYFKKKIINGSMCTRFIKYIRGNVFYWLSWLVYCVLWHNNPYRLFNAKSIFI